MQTTILKICKDLDLFNLPPRLSQYVRCSFHVVVFCIVVNYFYPPPSLRIFFCRKKLYCYNFNTFLFDLFEFKDWF